ncbi:MAG: glycosyltransferase family 4 protein [Xenococcaceae cyanobacterium]
MVDQLRILLSHAGTQYSYKTALALHSGKMLSHFYTPIYYKPTSPLYQLLERICGQQSWFISLKERRYHPKIPIEVVHSVPWFEIGYRLGSKLSRGRYDNALLTLQNNLYDRYVAQQLQPLKKDFDIFYGFSGTALQCLQQSKSLGKLTIIDHHDIHQETARQLMRSEIALHPDFADTFPYWPPYEPYLKKVEVEDKLADYHLVLSSFCRQTYVKAGIDRDRVFVVPLGTDIQKFSPGNPAANNSFRVLFVGAIGQRKGIKDLLEAFKKLSLPNAELVLAGKILGSGQPLSQYEGCFQHANYIEPSAMPDFYRSGSVFVLPSLWDSYGQVIIEAMACGLPVIVSENTAGEDVVRDGVDGFVIPIRNVDALAEKLLILYNDPELRQWMGQNAAVRSQEFSLQSYYRKLLDTLQTIWKQKYGLG